MICPECHRKIGFEPPRLPLTPAQKAMEWVAFALFVALGLIAVTLVGVVAAAVAARVLVG